MFKQIEKIFLLTMICLLNEHAVMAQDIKEIQIAPARQVQNNQSLSDDKVQKLESGTSSARIEGEVVHAVEPLNILFLLDCSLSMKEKMKDHTQKIEAAKQVLQKALARIPGDVNTGLRVFGQGNSRSMFGIFMNDCEQTALLVPLGQGNRRAIIDQVRYIRAFGMTPLTYALEQSAKSDFANTSGKKVIILISDGADTCGGDPCRLIRMLPAYGIRIKIDVVGLDLKHDRVARQQLNCITESSGGKYYDANSSEQFIGGVTESVNTAISGRVLPKIETHQESTIQP
jgi:Mg-chelatase subunit ChlD